MREDFVILTQSGFNVQCKREGRLPDGYRNFIVSYLEQRYKGLVYADEINLDAVTDGWGAQKTEKYLANAVSLGHNESPKEKPSSKKDGGISAEGLYQKLTNIDSNPQYFNSKFVEPKQKRNLYEDLQEDEVVINVDEIADMLAKDVMEFERLNYTKHIDRYKFLLDKYKVLIRSSRKNET